MIVIVTDLQTQKPISFGEVTQAVAAPIQKDISRPNAIRVCQEHYTDFDIAITAQGWKLHKIFQTT